MLFTIITPSFNQLDYLKRCVASVADQFEAFSQQPLANSPKVNASGSISVHHHIQDGDSTDGTVEWLRQYDSEIRGLRSEDNFPNAERLMPKTYSFSFQSERDSGMYDAINKAMVNCRLGFGVDGLQKEPHGENTSNFTPPTSNCNDEIVAWLNCDEQYLPSTLGKVARFFEAHPEVDILFGGMLMVDASGRLLACRKAMPMRRLFLEASYLYNYSCAMFFRASLWDKLGGFNTSFKNAGDEELVRRAVKSGAKTAVLDDYLSVFTYGGDNLSSDVSSAVQEHERLKQSGSAASRVLRLPLNLLRLAEKAFRGGRIARGTIGYDIYANQMNERTHFSAENPSCSWPDESRPYLLTHRLKGRSS